MLKIKIDKIGAELESSPEKCEMVEDAGNNIVDDHTWENDNIKELQLTPVKAVNFMNFLRRYSVVALADDFEYVEGEDDLRAGSMHTHISFKDADVTLDNSDSYVNDSETAVFDNIELNVYNEVCRATSWANVLAPVLFGKAPYTSRDCGLFKNESGYCRAQLVRNNKYNKSTDSKSYAITRNSAHTTLEFRVNENPIPLWVYWLPVLTYNNELFKELEDKFFDVYDYDNNDCLTHTGLKDVVKEAVGLAKSLLPAVLRYWKAEGINSFPQFKKIMTRYAEEDFNSAKVFYGTIKDILNKDNKWLSDYADKV